MTLNWHLLLIFTCTGICFPFNASPQCCSGGSGNPLAGGTSQGVLSEREVEANVNLQFIYTDKFYNRDSPDTSRSFDSFSSTYQYMRLGYGLTRNFTISVEGGYYFSKKETGLNENPATTYTSQGFGDLILFPRYDILNYEGERATTEVTAGLGYKIPIGSYNDSTGNIEPFSGNVYYVTKPQAVQLSSGAQDIIFYLFGARSYPVSGLNFFTNAMYIKKGWNANGEKLGDFMSIALFAGKTFFTRLGVTLQARYEVTKQMQINESILMFGRPSNYFPEATGYKKVFLVPQLTYTAGSFSFYLSRDLPVYQYVNSSEHYTQAGSKNLTTAGVSYRFFLPQPAKTNGTGKYCCPMHPDENSIRPGTCRVCKMDLEPVRK